MTPTHSLLEDIFGDLGYHVLKLSESDLRLFRSVVDNHYREVLSLEANVKKPSSLSADISDYHKIEDKIDHAKTWTKKNRILPKSGLRELYESEFFQFLGALTGVLDISSEEGSGYPEVYWRLVRPHPFKDTGPMHADAWFWELNPSDVSPDYTERVKVWIGLWTEPGSSGFQYVAGSHKLDVPYTSELRGGKRKPVFDHSEFGLQPESLNSTPGTIIFFNDKLLHGGVSGIEKTRVSLEFTFFVNSLDD